MKQQRSLSAIAAVAVFGLVLTACGGNTPAAAPITATATATATSSPAPTESAIIASSSPAATEPPVTVTAAPSPSPNEEGKVIKGTGNYVGQIDNHSVEIDTAEGATAFELGAGTESAPDTLNTDDPVAFEYVEKAVAGDATLKQRILTKLILNR
ncbi:hypothetical protein H1230_23330 [Paenibacillus sp. 19GGS1-52]|uniref:hypothetical protein n=1 Tax=Paenibacillus sp. 19GGS1-52 TaxID=2758563 RepID=UPI001EFAECE2|nr:hypothetical protein [Paenibacillus sp. 19GGS1-52]ULO05955.1 hypothetical protein H1230_23330 [Paenibacillus sp. 19GGS1-52]